MRRKVILLLVVPLAALGLWWQAEHPPVAEMDGRAVDLDRLIAHAQRCNDAYHGLDVFRSEYGGHVEVGEFPWSGLRIYLDAPATPGEGQWVLLRGTANLPNIIEDLEFIGEENHELGIQVHTGFDRALRECLPWVLERLDPGRPVHVTGHSLGGAVGVLLIATLEERGFREVSGVTFGQPKLTDAQGVAKLEQLDVLRVVHHADPVPMLPPIFVELDQLGIYHHAGPELVVHADGRLVHLLRHLEDRLNVVALWRDLRGVHVDSHDMTKGYLPALRKAHAVAGTDPN